MKLRIEFTHHTIQLNTHIVAPDGSQHQRDFFNIHEAVTQLRNHYQHFGYRLDAFVYEEFFVHGKKTVIAEARVLT